jgi:hypothetical protein
VGILAEVCEEEAKRYETSANPGVSSLQAFQFWRFFSVFI